MELLFSLKSTTTQYQRGVSALLVALYETCFRCFLELQQFASPPPPIRKMSRFLLMKLVAYLDQTAASRDWFSSWVWTRALPLRRLAAGIVLDLLAGVWHAAAAVRHRLSSVRLQARSGSPWRSFTASNRWTDGAHVFSKFCHGVTFGVFSVFLAFMKAAELPTATAIHTDTAVPSCYVNDRRPCA